MFPKVKTEERRGMQLKDKKKFISLHNADYPDNIRIKFTFSHAFYIKLIPVNVLKAYVNCLIVWQNW